MRGYDAGRVRERAQATALLAFSFLDQDELEQAVACGLEAISLTEHLESRRSLDAVGNLQRRFASYKRQGQVQEFNEAAAALLRAAS